MNRLLMSTAIVGLAALPGFAIAQSDEADDTLTQEQTETDSQAETGTGTDSDLDMEREDSDMDMDRDDADMDMDRDDADMGSDSDAMMSGDRPGVTEGHSEVDAATVEASEIEGAPVMSREGDDIANVSEVLLTEDGSIEAIVVNVGGFLGIGSKPVEVPFDEVTLQTNDQDGEMSIIIPMSEQELEDKPEYEED